MISRQTNNTTINASALTIGAMVALASVPSYTYATTDIPVVESIMIMEEPTTPKLATTNNYLSSINISIDEKKSNGKNIFVKEAIEVLPGIRSFTEEEGKRYEKHLISISKSTGENFFDLL